MATANKGLTLPANGSNVNSWDVPVNGNFSIIDSAFGGTTSLSTTTGAVTLTAAQCQNAFFVFTGTLSANVTYTIPSGTNGYWTYDTSGTTMGSYTITILYGGGGGSVVLPSNSQGSIFCTALGVKSLASTLTSTTGSGLSVLQTSPTIVTPTVTNGTLNGTAAGTPTTLSGYTSVTGTMNVPTQTAGTNSTLVASTAFVTTAVANATGGSNIGTIQSQTVPGNYTYTPSSGSVKWIRVTLVGGGGSGAAPASGSGYIAGYGGGAGGYCQFILAAASYPYSVGAGASAVAGAAGNTGGTSSFNGNVHYASGGQGGNYTYGGSGGTSVGGSVGATGGTGGLPPGIGYSGGPGGGSFFGSGGPSNTAGSNGLSGVAWGSGGSGGAAATTSGAGANGIVIIEEFFY